MSKHWGWLRIGVALALLILIAGCGRYGYLSYEVQDDADVSADMNNAIDLGRSDFGMDASADGDASQNDMEVDANDAGSEAPAVIVSPTTGLRTDESGVSDSFTITLATRPDASVFILLASSNTDEGVVAPSTVAFTTENWDAPQTVTITGVDDALRDGNQAFTITTGATVSADPNYSGLGVDDVSVTNVDDETPAILITPMRDLATSESGETDSFSVRLSTAPTSDVMISFSSSDPMEASVNAMALTFSTTNWSAPQTVVVAGVDDDTRDGNQPFTIDSDAAASSDVDYSGLHAPVLHGVNRDDETPAIVATPLTGLVTTEAGGTATFAVVLQSRPSAGVRVDISSDDSSEGTCDVSSLTFATTDWNVARIVTIAGADDSLVDGDQVFHINVGPGHSMDSNYDGLSSEAVSATNSDDDSARLLVSPSTRLTTTEGGGTATFTVTPSVAPSADINLTISSSNTAEGTVAPAELTFTSENWSTPQTITLTGVDDSAIDGNRDYFASLHVASSGDANYRGLADTHVDATNTDDESPGFTVQPESGLVTTEAATSATFSVRLNALPSSDVRVDLSSDSLSEGIVSPTSVTFTPLNWNVGQTVTVTGVDDSLVDGNRIYHIVTSPAVSPDAAYNGLDPHDVELSNLDDDVVGITISPTAVSAPEGGPSATFTVVLQSQPTSNVTLPMHIADSAQGSVSPPSLTFTMGNWNIAQNVSVSAVDDAATDGDVANTVMTDPTMSLDGAYHALDADDVAVTHADNDMASVVVTPTSGLVTSESGGIASFTVVLTSQPSSSVTVGLSSSDLTEGTVAPSSVVFTSGNWSVPQTVTVTGVDDLTADGAVAYSVVTANATSADSAYAGLAVSDVSIMNSDDEIPGFQLSPTSGLTTTEAGGTAMFTFVLSTIPTADVTIALTSSDTTEGTVSPNSLTFTSTDWNTPRVVVVTGVDDSIDDGNIAYAIVSAGAISADAAYSGLVAPSVSVSCIDDDAAGVLVVPTSGLVTTEAGATSSFTVSLAAQPGSNVTIALSSSNVAEGTVSPASFIFTSGNWSTPQAATVTGVDDFNVDGSIAYTIVTGATTSADSVWNGLAVSDVSATNSDNDVASATVSPTSGLTTTEIGGTATFTVVLSSRPTASVTSSFTSSLTTEGTVSPTSVVFTTANWNSPRTITVTGVNDNYDDGDRAFSILTNALTSADTNYSGVNPTDVSVTNTDDDTADLTFTPVISGSTTDENGRMAQILVTPTCTASASVTSVFSSGDSTEGFLVSPVGTSGGWTPSFPLLVTMRGVDDLIDDGDVAYGVVVTLTSADPAWNGRMFTYSGFTNLDNENTDVAVSPNTNRIVTDAGLTAQFNVVLTRAPTANVTIMLTSSDLTEGTVSPASLTFTTANWSSVRTVTVTGVTDGVLDGDQVFSIVTSPVTSTDLSYNGLDPDDVSVIAVDPESARLIDATALYAPGNQNMNPVPKPGTAVSVTGRYVAFDCPSSNLVAGDSNGLTDVFVRDLQLGTTTRASVTNAGAQAGGSQGAISSDGGFVVFTTNLATLVAGDTNGVNDVFVRDLAMGTTTRVSLSETGTELNGASSYGAVSANGRFVAFVSAATNAVTGDTNGQDDIFVRDTMLNTTTRISVTTAGAQSTATNTVPLISDDGRYVAFMSSFAYVVGDTNFTQDVYIRDTMSNTTTCASLTSLGAAIPGGVTYSTASMSSDGRYVAFASGWSSVVPGDTNAADDIFVRDTVMGTVSLISLTNGGAQGNGVSFYPSISADGSRIAFVSRATNLTAETLTGVQDIFVRDRNAGTTTLISKSQTGVPANLTSYWTVISGDGHTIATATSATNLLYETFDVNSAISLYAAPLP